MMKLVNKAYGERERERERERECKCQVCTHGLGCSKRFKSNQLSEVYHGDV